MNYWQGFKPGKWQVQIDVADFIKQNYTPYEGDEVFLKGKSPKTTALWHKAERLIQEEIEKGIIGVETTRFSGIDVFDPGYLDKDNEVIVGLQTDEPLKRIVNPYGGYRMVKKSLAAYGYELDAELESRFQEFCKTHNDGVFDAYTDQMRLVRSTGLLTGLPDAYGRGRIIGDYRRIPLYGIKALLKGKIEDLSNIKGPTTSDVIRLREEISEQIRALNAIQAMSATYGFDISKPAVNATEAVQFLYFGYLAAIKENNGAAMSLGRNTAFIDIFIERDLDLGLLSEDGAQELIDQLVIKLRMARHLRTPEYNELFAGDPNWITEALGGMGTDGRTMVTKTAYRFLHTLTNLSPAPEPNMTVLWSQELPIAFKKYCSKMSQVTGALQYENDDLMRPIYGDDYGIACCVSAMEIGKAMQFFGARTNLAKALLYAINGGVDELKRDRGGAPVRVMEGIEPIEDAFLDFDKVYANYLKVLDQLAEVYVNTMNTIHYMHDKYAYEAGQMALHDSQVHRYMAFGVAGVSLVADSLSAIKFANVKPVRDKNGIAVNFTIEGEYPAYGNDDDRVDQLAVDIVEYFSEALKKYPTYRQAEPTLSILTITSNVVYGKKTGATPDGRKLGEPFAPGANPMHGRDKTGALASLNSVAKFDYENSCKDGISNTMSVAPQALGKESALQVQNLVHIMDAYFAKGAFHLNVNVMNRELLLNAMEHPEKYPNLTIRVSGYAVHFNRLSGEQKEEVIARTFHESA